MKKGYGFDRLSRDILILSVALGALSAVFSFMIAGPVLSVVSAALALIALLRCVSMKIERRQDELLGYEKLTGAVSGFFKKLFQNKNDDPNYKYFRCPDCRERMRAPKGKGRIRVTCRRCGKQFEKTV